MRKNKSVMKGVLSSLALLVLTTFVFTSGVLAASRTVSGKIKTAANANANGASVSVTCNGNTLNTTTASNGNFSVTFADGQCNQGDTVTVNANLNGENASESQTAGPGAGTISFNVITLAGVVAVPEFGLITGLVAAAGSGIAYMKMRKGMA